MIFIPKCRKIELYGENWKFLGQEFHELTNEKNCKTLAGYMVNDHVHMMIKTPPKFA